MIDPTMNAIPARKKSLPTTSAAAAMLSAKPVSEIALGVSRDSIRRSFMSACVAAPLRRGRGRKARSGGGVAERPSVWPCAGQQLLGEQRSDAGGDAAQEDVGEVVVAGGHDH